jgi:hypothetical protein
MRQATHSARPLSVPLIGFAIALCATAALALPPKAEAVVRLGSTNTVSLTNGLVGYWPLDGATTNWISNTTRDLSGQGNTGHLYALSTSTTPAPGKIGQAFKFIPDNNQYVFVDDDISLKPATITVSAWVKWVSHTPNYHTAVIKSDESECNAC